jgi:hypothetical protein
MKKRVIFLSCGATFLLILVSFSSAIGFTASTQQSHRAATDSPLFSIRTSRSIGQQVDHSLMVTYLGKGKSSPLFLTQRSSNQALIERALQMLRTSPDRIEQALRNILKDHQMQLMLFEKGISQQDVMMCFNEAKNNPELLASQLAGVADSISINGDTKPTQLLNTTNPFACIITVIVLLPVMLVVGLLIATLTIVTCLNVNDCFDTLMQNILQGLHSP